MLTLRWCRLQTRRWRFGGPQHVVAVVDARGRRDLPFKASYLAGKDVSVEIMAVGQVTFLICLRYKAGAKWGHVFS